MQKSPEQTTIDVLHIALSMLDPEMRTSADSRRVAVRLSAIRQIADPDLLRQPRSADANPNLQTTVEECLGDRILRQMNERKVAAEKTTYAVEDIEADERDAARYRAVRWAAIAGDPNATEEDFDMEADQIIDRRREAARAGR